MSYEFGTMMEKVITKAIEEEDRFIFETIRPFCENVTQKVIPKKDLEQAIVRYYNRGNWIHEPIEGMVGLGAEVRCSICRKVQKLVTNFCPECGADMRNIE